MTGSLVIRRETRNIRGSWRSDLRPNVQNRNGPEKEKMTNYEGC